MSETTTTRKILRRAIALELQMPFFRRFSAGESTIDAGSTTTKIIDANLKQPDTFWNGMWFYGLDAGDLSVIRSYIAGYRSFQIETPMATTPDAGDLYEIHTMWNPVEIHAAINRAIAIGGRSFMESVVDETLVLCENTLSYSLTGLAKAVLMINKVWIEDPTSLTTGQATAGGASTITVQSLPSGINTNFKVSIYDGTGAGQVRSYASAAGLVVTINTAWTTQPDSTSKYAIWDASDQQNDWIPLTMAYTDAKEYPDALRLRYLYPGHYGCRIRIEYISIPIALSSDTSTTVVPSEYIIPKACAILHGQRLNDNKADRELHYAESQRYDEMAENYLIRNAPHLPDTTIWRQRDGQWHNDVFGDPLGWW